MYIYLSYIVLYIYLQGHLGKHLSDDLMQWIFILNWFIGIKQQSKVNQQILCNP